MNALTRFISKTQGMPASELLQKIGIVIVAGVIATASYIHCKRVTEGISINSKREMEAISINSKREMEAIAIDSKQQQLDIIYHDKVRNIELDKKYK